MTLSSIDLASKGDDLAEAGRFDEALEAYRMSEGLSEQIDADLALKIARTCFRVGDNAGAARSLTRVVDSDAFRPWTAAAKLLERVPADVLPTKRSLEVAVLGTYTTLQFTPFLRLAGLRFGLDLKVYDAPYGQLEQEVLDPTSGLYATARDYIVFAIHEGATAFPLVAQGDPHAAVEIEVERWTALWETTRERSGGARIVHHLPAQTADEPLGHLAARLPSSRRALHSRLNERLGAAAGDDVIVVDCERLSAQVGSRTWFDPRYWHLSKQAVALDALPLLARATAATIAADAGLSKRCVVLDLDNTVWGGVIGEDGLEGIRVGGDAEGEAYQRFQSYLHDLSQRGIVLAVVSKNEESDARLPFERHPDMRLRLDDIAAFVANWEPKAKNVGQLAVELELGLDSLVFVDDNPIEREALRRALPEVDVIALPNDPALFVQALADYPLLEPSRLTREDANRTAQYKARAKVNRERASAPDLESFLRGLEMSAAVEEFDELRLPRIAQLVSKTNQFNTTTRRHNADVLRSVMEEPNWVGYSLQLSDRMVDHGLVAVAIAEQKNGVLDIDTFLMSCRVMGRTVETTLLAELSAEAERRSCRSLRGTFIPSERNRPAADLFARHGFTIARDDDGVTVWVYDLQTQGEIANELIEVRR